MNIKTKYTKSKEINLETCGCSNCEDEVDYCFECGKSLENKEFYCDGFGEHICIKCYKKLGEK